MRDETLKNIELESELHFIDPDQSTEVISTRDIQTATMLSLLDISMSNLNFVMPPPNLTGYVHGLWSVFYGPAHMYELAVEFGEQEHDWYVANRRKEAADRDPRPVPSWQAKHPEWNLLLHNYPYTVTHDSILVVEHWQSTEIERLIYTDLDFIAVIVRAVKSGFERNVVRSVQSAVLRRIVPAYLQLYPDDTGVVRKSLEKAVPHIADWALACFCSEVEFWLPIIRNNIDYIMAKQAAAASTGMVFKHKLPEVYTVNQAAVKETPNVDQSTDLIAAYRQRVKQANAVANSNANSKAGTPAVHQPTAGQSNVDELHSSRDERDDPFK